MKRKKQNDENEEPKKRKMDGERKVGRPAKVSSTEAIQVIKKYIEYFETNAIPQYTSDIWQKMSNDLSGKWNAHTVYTHVRENRRRDLATARREMGMMTAPIDKPVFKDEVNTSKSSNSVQSSSESDYDDKFVDAIDIKKLDCFYLVLKKEEWMEIEPDRTDAKSSKRLKKNVWTNVISKAFTRLYRLPCAFMFRWSNVNWNGNNNRSLFLTIRGECGSKKCKNPLVGYANEKPGIDGQLHMEIFTADTRDKDHEVVKRPLNGEERIKVGESLKGKNCRKYQKKQAAKEMVFGEDEHVHQHAGYVLRKAKKEQIDSALGLKASDKHDLIKAIEDMSIDIQMFGVIRFVSRLPFSTMYFLREQLATWNEFSRLMKESAEVAIDATGSLARPLPRPDGSKGGHIFLYSVTINFRGSTEAVYQMLSESHDTEYIEFWLKRWSRWGARIPARAVGDYSRALQTGMCLAFTNKTIKQYVDAWFKWAKAGKDQPVGAQPTSTILGVDVAHLVALVTKWKCFDAKKQTVIKNLYVRAVTLMIDAESVDDFGYILLLTCLVALSEYQDIPTGIPLIPTAKDARKRLEGLIATRNPEIDDEQVANAILAQEETPKDYPTEPEDSQNSTLTVTHEWVRKVIVKATPNPAIDQEDLSPTKDVNSFWFPSFIPHLESIAKEFPLWTSATVPYRMGHFSSSYMEAYFRELKGWIKAEYGKPLRIDKFLKIHILEDLIGGNKLLTGKLKKYNQNEGTSQPPRVTDYPEGTGAPGPYTGSGQDISVPADLAGCPEGTRAPDANTGSSQHTSVHSELSGDPIVDGEASSCQSSNTRTTRGISSHSMDLSTSDRNFAKNSQAWSDSGNIHHGEKVEKSTSITEETSFVNSTPLDHNYSAEDVPHNRSRSFKVLIEDDDVCNFPSVDFLYINDSDLNIIQDTGNSTNTNMPTTDTLRPVDEHQIDLLLSGVHTGDESKERNRIGDDSDLLSTEHWRGLINHDGYYYFSDDNNNDSLCKNGPGTIYCNIPETQTPPVAPSTICENPHFDDTQNLHLDTHKNFTVQSREIRPNFTAKDKLKIFKKSQISPLHLPLHHRKIKDENKKENKPQKIEKSLVPSFPRPAKEKTNAKPKDPSWYFSKCPTIQCINALGIQKMNKRVKSDHLIPNGLSCDAVTIDRQKFFVDYTCPYDSIVQILSVTAGDDPHYRQHIEKTDHPVFKFINKFLFSGPTKQILKDRAAILKSLYCMDKRDKDCQPSNLKSLTPLHLDAEDVLSAAWTKLFQTEPSVVKTFQCNNPICKPVSTAKSFMSVDYPTIGKGGFSELRKALKFYPKMYNVKCRDPKCDGSGTESFCCNSQIFIELDVRTSKCLQTGLTCMLGNFPEILELEVPYRLVGVVGYTPGKKGHFIAYCRRITGRWKKYNDLSTAITPVDANLEILPHGVIYVLSHDS